ncbi:unnamed protein product [Cylicostephanus goldi]|uniref:Uncharacterized protein n=1 Tax=Cylicostephanus goldi TaxID=71465 RepID=A0A3P7PXZ4_CYLGO|nr:unnamed protein product [Cylicostephanus goldi]
MDANLSKASSKTEGAVALADELVLEFLFMELTEPQAAQMAKNAGDGAMFDRNPVLEQLASVSKASSQFFSMGNACGTSTY